MNYKIIVTEKFSKNIKQLKKKYKKIKEDFDKCIALLEKNPFAGTFLGKGLYKLRVKSSDISKGKSGGFRIIYYLITGDNTLYLLTIYPKSKIETISMEGILRILNELQIETD
ncbi:MAG: type II toxin-antitoxin system RelE/ParE family toxin [Candidatus Aminicenantes bacterium]|nr:type II toxin-antitoxin system RelE/ParE family toxin [Candidatus Aminicenantes bacterium]